MFWSRQVMISLADSPRLRIREFKESIADWRVISVTGAPVLSTFKSSSSSSWLHFSAHGFLLMFFTFPSSSVMPLDDSMVSTFRDLKAGALSTLTVHDGVRRNEHLISAVRRDGAVSSGTIVAVVYAEWISR